MGGLAAIGTGVSWGEALRLVKLLRADPTSWLFATIEGWDYPASRTELLLADMYDLEVMVNSDPKKGQPDPHSMRPVALKARPTARDGNAGGRTDAEVKAILARFGHPTD